VKKLAILAGLFFAEVVLFTLWLDGAVLIGRGGIAGEIGA
jgi:hypothetical protein